MGEDSDKTEEPTEHKLQESRKKGQIFKSQDIIQTALLLTTMGILYMERSWLVSTLRRLMEWSFNLISTDINLPERYFTKDLLMVLINYFAVLAPLLGAAFIVAFVVNVAQVKFIISFESMQPKLSKLNPVEGFKRIFSMKSLFELFKQIVKLGAVTWVCVKVIQNEILSLKNAIFWSIPKTISLIRSMSARVVSYVLVTMFTLSIIDYIFQKKQFMKQMKMSIKELKDEYKDTEGNPQVKGKIRQLMRQGAQARMMSEVPNSSAVVTNPTHLAVAIRYNPGQDTAPVVVAKGERLVAVQIKILAEDNEIPIIENVELARAIFAACDVGASIPVELYKATAEVLAYIFRLKKKRELMRRKKYMTGRSVSMAR